MFAKFAINNYCMKETVCYLVEANKRKLNYKNFLSKHGENKEIPFPKIETIFFIVDSNQNPVLNISMFNILFLSNKLSL